MPSAEVAGGSGPLVIDGGPLGFSEVEDVARRGRRVELGAPALAAIAQGRRRLEAVLGDGEAHYGVNTGFGSFSRERIGHAELQDLQRNLVRSHAAGVGPALATPTVRGMMLLLAASLSRGLSGIRAETAAGLIAMLNARAPNGAVGVTPVVPSIGSVGASGDLAPLAHVALVLIGEGEAEFGGRRMTGGEALHAAGITPVTLEAKEGLALINGTHLMAAEGALLAVDAGRVLSAALAAAAMSIDACRATDAFLDPRVHDARRQPGQVEVARRVSAMLAGSGIIPSHTLNDPRVQDPYSLRCVPQVLGAAVDALRYVTGALERELGAVTDNPLVFEDGIVSAGNFHGMPLALPLDVLAIALAHVAGIAERRVYHMLSGFDAETGLPPFLSPKPGLHSGLMIAQYTAAACVNELVGLANPASVANVSTSAGMEDYNSFGPRSAAKARRALELCRSVVAIELLAAGEALEHHRPLKSGPAVERAFEAVRAVVPKLTADRPPAPDIAAIERLIASGAIGA